LECKFSNCIGRVTLTKLIILLNTGIIIVFNSLLNICEENGIKTGL
jgi:hypothetical protein